MYKYTNEQVIVNFLKVSLRYILYLQNTFYKFFILKTSLKSILHNTVETTMLSGFDNIQIVLKMVNFLGHTHTHIIFLD